MHELVGAIIIFGFPLLSLYIVVRIARLAWKGK